MTTRLILICHAALATTPDARFPADDRPGAKALAAARRTLSAPALCATLAQARRRLVAPERRTRATAALVGTDFVTDASLRDGDLGLWRGRALATVAAEEPEALAAYLGPDSAPAPGGESVADIVARMDAWMELQADRGGRVLAVTHPALVRAAVVSALRAGPSSFWHVEAGPLCVASFSHDGRRWTLAGLVPPARG